MPRGDGHTLIIPKFPARGLLDVPPDVLSSLITRVQKIGAAAVKAFAADGLTLLQFNETAGGQQVFHLHFHVLPRFEGVSLRPHSSEMAPPAVLKAQAAQIAQALD